MKFDFKNRNGEVLSGNLEMPSMPVRATALFAHCFTCSKDIIAPNIISKTLKESGIAVLRFDFTGLGSSQGDFSNTNFSSNIDDLLAAYSALSEEIMPPEIIIGHSLGGAAVLKVAGMLEKVKAVVTIGAPSDVQHVKHLFDNDLDKIEKDGEAQVNLAGRKFTIKKQFIDDISEVTILDGLSSLKKALLVMHSPIDDTVSVDHAAKIFKSAKHPKSFISLDNSGHLLMNKRDARYAGEIINSWVGRYISPATQDKESIAKDEVVVKSRKNMKFTHDILTNKHSIIADEPLSVKGAEDLGMNPYELVMAGLGACTSMTLKMYAEHKGLNLQEVKVKLKHQKIHADDCETCETKTGKIDHIEKEISITGDITSDQRKRLLEIADKCPVNKTLQSEIMITSNH